MEHARSELTILYRIVLTILLLNAIGLLALANVSGPFSERIISLAGGGVAAYTVLLTWIDYRAYQTRKQLRGS